MEGCAPGAGEGGDRLLLPPLCPPAGSLLFGPPAHAGGQPWLCSGDARDIREGTHPFPFAIYPAAKISGA